MCQNGTGCGTICIQDLGQGKEENFRLGTWKVWKRALSLEKKEWTSREGEGDILN